MTITVKDAAGADVVLKTAEEVAALVDGDAADAAYVSGSGKTIGILKGIFGKVAALLTVGGQSAHDAAITGNPLRIGGRARTSNITAVSNDDAIDAVMSIQGQLITKPYAVPEVDWTATGIYNSTTSVAMKAAAGAGIRNYLTWLAISPDVSVTFVEVRDGASVIFRQRVGNGAPMVIPFPTPLRTTANTALNVAGNDGTTVYWSAGGYTGS